MNDQYIFTKTSATENESSYIENSYVAPEGEPWPVIILHFATFLESCGYLGVYDRVEDAFGEGL